MEQKFEIEALNGGGYVLTVDNTRTAFDSYEKLKERLIKYLNQCLLRVDANRNSKIGVTISQFDGGFPKATPT